MGELLYFKEKPVIYGRNRVILGDYFKQRVEREFYFGDVIIRCPFTKRIIKINSATAEYYDVLDTFERKSGKKIYVSVIFFTDGKKSIVEIDENIHLLLVKQVLLGKL